MDVGDDHHRDALGRDTRAFEILHQPGEMTGSGPKNITEAGIDQHTIGRRVDHEQIIGELWRLAEAIFPEKRFGR